MAAGGVFCPIAITFVIILICQGCRCSVTGKFNSFSSCYKPDEQVVTNVSIFNEVRQSYVTYSQLVDNLAKDIPLVIVKLCRRDVKHGKCKHIFTFRYTNFCPKLLDTKAVWAGWFRGYNPPFRCPIKQGTYQVTNATMPISVIELVPFPMDGFNWTVRTIYHNEENKMFVCYDLDVSIYAY